MAHEVMDPPCRIVGLAGSLRPQSVSQHVLSHVGAALTGLGAEVELLDLRSMPLPLCSGDKADDYGGCHHVATLRQAFLRAQGVVLVTPEYHGSVSGVLKNVLDLLDFAHLEGRVTAMISVLGGRTSSNALNHLRTMLRWCRCWTIPEQIAIPRSRFGLDGALERDPELAGRFSDLCSSLVDASRLLTQPTAPVVEHVAGGAPERITRSIKDFAKPLCHDT